MSRAAALSPATSAQDYPLAPAAWNPGAIAFADVRRPGDVPRSVESALSWTAALSVRPLGNTPEEGGASLGAAARY